MNPEKFDVHPLAALFPLIPGGPYGTLCNGEGGDFGKLCLDIKDKGLIDPIVRHEGKILDGRNRWLACKVVGVKPNFVELSSLNLPCTPEEYVWSQNMTRRHLTADQRAAIAQMWQLQLASAAKERSIANLRRGKTKQAPPELAKTPDREGAREPISATPTRTNLAKLAEGTEYKARLASEIARARPDLLQKVKDGELSLRDARKEMVVAGAPRKFDPPREAQRIFSLVESAIEDKPAREVKILLTTLVACLRQTWAEIKDKQPTHVCRKKPVKRTHRLFPKNTSTSGKNNRAWIALWASRQHGHSKGTLSLFWWEVENSLYRLGSARRRLQLHRDLCRISGRSTGAPKRAEPRDHQ